MENDDVQLGRGTVAGAERMLHEAVTEEARKAGGDPKLAARRLFNRLTESPGLAKALFTSFAGQAYLDLKRGARR